MIEMRKISIDSWRLPPNIDKDQANQVVMIIGNNNVFEVGSSKLLLSICFFFTPSFLAIYLEDCEALKVGDNNILECKGNSWII